ncbi:hypothetical protein WOLCODRAFT_136630 [Wolfiporia cocos MD-104 SS10]|uniref:Zn(2)-C6 fungal-type domain-containing protein n=1 Tax=Wolfiporia cocos (strain MD-104) TaxID=742152 RepID=A0A2H3JMM3_WOLCO|nr:hypothetical protein WOLCODRAFT_136630 [Wolfiporia cocos MD-104 SS10]
MDPVDLRTRRDERPADDYPPVKEEPTASRILPGPSAASDTMDGEPSGYTLMVAGRRSGKTSFLRLLLDTSVVAHTVTRDQLVSVAKFVQGCSGHTSHVRTVSVDVDLPAGDSDETQRLNLTLIDTPSIDFEDKDSSQRTVSEILRHIDARFTESVDDERKALTGHHHVHLCIYFLDPDHIVPPSVPLPPVPLVSRARANSLSVPEAGPVILEPPVTTNPLLCRPTLPAADIETIQRLSARVNVLPVVARADTLTNDRLAAVKLAIRRDLAEAGIGFGIFDMHTFPQYQRRDSSELTPPARASNSPNGYPHHVKGAASTANSPPSTPISPSYVQLPFALISPDIYSHSDGITRPALSRQDLALHYTPLHPHADVKNRSRSKLVLGRFIRSYRWGSLDVMDATHCDFVFLRGAIFHHMQTLQKYTREYLLQKFRAEAQLNQHHPAPTRATQPSVPMSTRLPPLTHGSRPILAIDTTPSHAINRPPPQPFSRTGIVLNGNGNGNGNVSVNGDAARPVASPQPQAVSETSPRTATSSRSQRGSRTKKITVACNFCRSRKLKCDGGRPACSQCFKRSNPCDYTATHKRRGNGKARKQFDESDSEGDSIEDPSADQENPSQSPEVVSQPPSRRNSSVNMLLTETLPPLATAMSRDEQSTVLPPIAHAPSGIVTVSLQEAHPDLPSIASLSAPHGMSREDATAQSLSEDGRMTQRRRTPAAPSGRSRSNHGSKIVACNICRARKTRCDGAHPTCGSCSRRSLPCNYVNDPSTSRARAKGPGATGSGPSSSRSSPALLLPYGGQMNAAQINGITRRITSVDTGSADHGGPAKKMRLASEGGRPILAPAQAT